MIPRRLLTTYLRLKIALTRLASHESAQMKVKVILNTKTSLPGEATGRISWKKLFPFNAHL